MQPLTNLEEVHMLKKGIELEPEQYARVLQYLHSIGQTQWTSWLDDVGSLMDDGDLVLPPHVLMPSEFKLDERTYSRKTSHEGNSGIQFKDPLAAEQLHTGYIQQIWQMSLHGHLQTFLLIEKHTPLLSPLRESRPFHHRKWLQAAIVEAEPSHNFCIIEPRHILTHLAVYKPVLGAYALNWNCMVISWALNRERWV
ncbi:hypothetical protein C8F01DRAFT_988280 [Mycena amicta]|nr:hypothetical protein C8F01DRAFT_988280 [Mycena amicta]